MKTCKICSNTLDINLFYFHVKKRQYSSSCKKCRLEKARKWNKENTVSHVNHQRKWRENNRDLDIQRSTNRLKNPINRIKSRLRSRLRDAIKDNQKIGSAVKNLGCTVQELKNHLESKFQLGMTWENWGIHGWHIDHIVPLCKFNLLNSEELKQACHYTNLQPLWAKDNLKKGNKSQLITVV